MRIRPSLVLLATTALAATTLVSAQTPVVSGGGAPASDLIRTTVAVLDQTTGLAPRGLTGGDFELLVDGVPTPIQKVSDRPEPLRLAILIDLSRSANLRTSGVAALLARALDRVLFSTMGPDDRVLVGALGSRMVLSKFSGDRVQLVYDVDETIRRPEGELYGPSPLWDQVDEVSRNMADAPGRKAVLLLSDGRATGNRLGVGAVALRAAMADVTISAIGQASSMTIRQDEMTMVRISPDSGLRALALTSGGIFISGALATLRVGADVPSFDPAPQLARVISHLREAYVLEFAPAVRDGNMHPIEVRMKAANQTAATRRFYRAPAKAGPPGRPVE
jgi:VWFA-related protein